MDQTFTSLFGDERVQKDDDRICLRGLLDSLCAWAVLCGTVLIRNGHSTQQSMLSRVIQSLRHLQEAEARNCDLERFLYSEEEWEKHHEDSHHPSCGHVFCTPEMGEGMAYLNVLRTKVRDCERGMISVYGASRPQAIHCLNRLSSVVYCMMCDLYSGNKEKEPNDGK